MDVKIVAFPETKVAAIEHWGAPATEYETVRKLVAWKLQHGLTDPAKHRHYGLHHTDMRKAAPEQHHVTFCLSVESDVAPNAFGIVNAIIPANPCAFARDIGSRQNNQAALYLGEIWLPQSGEQHGDFPIFFHYANVGPSVRPEDMITDVYLPLK